MPLRTPYSSSTMRMLPSAMVVSSPGPLGQAVAGLAGELLDHGEHLLAGHRLVQEPGEPAPLAQPAGLAVEPLAGLGGHAAEHDERDVAEPLVLADLVAEPEPVVHVFHHQVEEDDRGGLVLEQAQRLVRALRRQHAVAVRLQVQLLALQEVPVVVHEQDRHRGGHVVAPLSSISTAPPAWVLGSSTWKVVPRSVSVSNQMVPLCILMIP